MIQKKIPLIIYKHLTAEAKESAGDQFPLEQGLAGGNWKWFQRRQFDLKAVQSGEGVDSEEPLRATIHLGVSSLRESCWTLILVESACRTDSLKKSIVANYETGVLPYCAEEAGTLQQIRRDILREKKLLLKADNKVRDRRTI